MKALIFTANYGNGHKSVADELEYIFETLESEVVITNPHYELNRPLTRLVELSYTKVFIRCASNRLVNYLYGWAFETFGNKHSSLFSKYGSKTMVKIVEREKPDLVVLTFPFHCRDLNVPTYSIITDYGFSKVWYSDNVDTYIVASDEARIELAKHAKDAKIFQAGIPVHSKFSAVDNSSHISRVAINLGAVGSGSKRKITNLINSVRDLGLTVEIICGRNKRLFKKLSEEYKNCEDIIIHGYVNDMYNIYGRCQLLVSKAGGITTTEAISSEIPLIINSTASLSGQEQYNVDFVANHDIGRVCKAREIYDTIKFYIDNPDAYIQSRNNMHQIKAGFKRERELVEQQIAEVIND